MSHVKAKEGRELARWCYVTISCEGAKNSRELLKAPKGRIHLTSDSRVNLGKEESCYHRTVGCQ
jgi:hypothetical protein